MSDEEDKVITAHVAGATVTHESPFSNLEIPVSAAETSMEFYERWVVPFYRVNLHYSMDNEFKENFTKVINEFDYEIGKLLLAEFNWRSRITAGFFCAVKPIEDLMVYIGNLFLRSEVCYAGSGYCLALSQFNDSAVIEYLRKYLEYYLRQNELWFEQGKAMAVLAYLDKRNGTSILDDYTPLWEQYIKDRPNLSLKREIKEFEKQIREVEALRELCS